MRLFFDEDQGKGVAIALSEVGVPTDHVGSKRRIRKGTRDEEWIPIAGEQGWLVISGNKEILTTETQRRLWISHGVGGIFFTTNQIKAIDKLRLLLRKHQWLEDIDRDVARPFAFTVTPRGYTRRML